MNIQKMPIDFYVEKLRQGQHYTFARYGDGEWNAIKGKRGCNCDKHEYYPALGKALKRGFIKPVRDPSYMYALQTQTDLTKRGDVQDFFRAHMSDIMLYDSDVFHCASEAGTLFPLVEQLRKMHCCIVGPAELRAMREGVLVYEGFVETPSKNCFLQLDYIRDKVLRYADVVTGQGVVYCFSASMATEVLLYELWPKLGRDNWMIDFGSLWDVYVGHNSRKYHSRIPEDVKKKNMGTLK
uniref:Uncharacterized protein n=1 Tax=viral metagenome TaxID=1070528 RepID=A0A6M3LA62_9ZZZZ